MPRGEPVPVTGKASISALLGRIEPEIRAQIERIDMSDDRLGQIGCGLVGIAPDEIAQSVAQDIGSEMDE